MRSDSHGVAFQVGSDRLRFQGSPARAIGDGDAVFGAGAARASDVGGCVEAMCALLGPGLGVSTVFATRPRRVGTRGQPTDGWTSPYTAVLTGLHR